MSDYGKYCTKLIQDFDVNSEQMRQALGSPGGTYEDTLLLLLKLVAHEKTIDVLEFGSGLSTLALSKACTKLNKNLVTIEHDLYWGGVTNAALKQIGLDFRVVSTGMRPENCPIFNETQFQIVWIDGSIFGMERDPAPVGVDSRFIGRFGSCYYYKQNLENAVLVFDDAQRREDASAFNRIYEEFGRTEADSVWFNPTGRKDRHQLIFFPPDSQHYKNIVFEVSNF